MQKIIRKCLSFANKTNNYANAPERYQTHYWGQNIQIT